MSWSLALRVLLGSLLLFVAGAKVLWQVSTTDLPGVLREPGVYWGSVVVEAVLAVALTSTRMVRAVGVVTLVLFLAYAVLLAHLHGTGGDVASCGCLGSLRLSYLEHSSLIVIGSGLGLGLLLEERRGRSPERS